MSWIYVVYKYQAVIRWIIIMSMVRAGKSQVTSTSLVEPAHDNITCRDSWVQNMTFHQYKNLTCSKCFVQLFFDQKELGILTYNLPHNTIVPMPPYMLFHKFNYSIEPIWPDVGDESPVCKDYLNTEECIKWRDCCAAAIQCCLDVQQADVDDDDHCPATWDGVACWEPTPSSSVTSQECPYYYKHDELRWFSRQAHRTCENDTWHKDPASQNELTDYKECFDSQVVQDMLYAVVYIGIVGNSASVLCLIASIVIFVAFRNLRKELLQRDSIRLHLNLFVSIILLGIFLIIFDVHSYEWLQNQGMSSTKIWFCILNVLRVYARSSSYMCMFCEGLYLYRRISNVMQVGVIEPMTKYYIIAWVFPLIPVTTYAIVRFGVFGQECVLHAQDGMLEFIYLVPDMLSMACNIIFLISIEWMLCTKLRHDSTDRQVQVLRHALRATFSLVPIFGVQFIFIIYRPEQFVPYEIISVIFTSTQGIMVAALYCFSNKEVKDEFRKRFHDCKIRRQNSIASSSVSGLARNAVPRGSVDYPMEYGRRFSRSQPRKSIVETALMLPPGDNRRPSNMSVTTNYTLLNGTSINGSGSTLYNSQCEFGSLSPSVFTKGCTKETARDRSGSAPNTSGQDIEFINMKRLQSPERPRSAVLSDSDSERPLLEKERPKSIMIVPSDSSGGLLTPIEEDESPRNNKD